MPAGPRCRPSCSAPPSRKPPAPRHLGTADLSKIAKGYAPHGFTMIMLPAFSDSHAAFAVDGATDPGLFDQPLLGWVTGVHVNDIGRRAPKVFDRATGRGQDEGAVLLHVALPPGGSGQPGHSQHFAQGDRPELAFVFNSEGFSARQATANGQVVDLARTSATTASTPACR